MYVNTTSCIMMIFKLIVHAVCVLLFVCKSIEGSDIDCTVDCACCIDKECGSNQWFSSGVCTNGCIDGYASARCYKKCPVNCIRCISENNKEYCNGCHDGYYPGPDRHCTAKCLPNCKTCTSGSSCTSCKEGYHNENGSNDCRYRTCPENCKCENDQCVSCKNGYYDISNSCISLCPSNCVTCLSTSYCDTCKDGHYNGYQNDDSSLPLLNNCTYNCGENCIQCSSFEVCLACKSGFYGPFCEECSTGCISNSCNIKTGQCTCSPKYIGDKCDQCENGQYGNMCELQCPVGCKGNECDKESGKCTRGCFIDIIIGDKCDVCPADVELKGETIGNNSYHTIQDTPQKNTDIVLGSVLAVSIVWNIILAAVLIFLLKCRKRVTTDEKTRGNLYENTDVELKGGTIGNNSPHNLQASNINNVSMSRDYDDLGNVQEAEHEYGQIR